MDADVVLRALEDEYEGDLLSLSDDKRIVNVKYTTGSLPFFSKLEILVARNDDSLFSQEPDFRLFVYWNFHPMANLLRKSAELTDEMVEEVKQQVLDGLFSFIRLNRGHAELITVSVGNLENLESIPEM